MNIEEIKAENVTIRGYLNQREIIHIAYVLITWSISSGYITFIFNLLPPWLQPISMIITTTLVGLWKVLRFLDKGL